MKRLHSAAVLSCILLSSSFVAGQDHGILREVFEGIPGANVADLVNHESFPDSPTSTNIVTDYFESPTNIGDFYGQRMHGFIIPPVTGQYVFWIATDDGGELHLSTNESPENTSLIASVNGWAPPRDWFREPNQQSAPISLEAGERYYISALMKEHGGGDNLAVRWRLPDGTIEEPVPATRMLPFGAVTDPPLITAHPQSKAVVEGDRVSFQVSVSNLDPLEYQWQRNEADIPGATGSIYTLDRATLDHDGSQFRVWLSNSLGDTFSHEAILSVQPDTTPPTLITAHNVGSNTVRVTFSERLDATTATSAENYRFDGGVSITSATLSNDEKTVILATSTLASGTVYTLTVNNVQDIASTPNTIAADSQISFVASDFSPSDIGTFTPSSVTHVEGGLDVLVGGRGIGDGSDNLRLDFVERTGNFDLKVRVAALELSDFRAMAGLMARETLDPASPFAASLTTPSISGSFFKSRGSTGASPQMQGAFRNNFPHTWLRLQRAGNTFTGYASLDGHTWTRLGSRSISMGETVFVGLATAANHESAATTAQFRDFGPAEEGVTGRLPVESEPLGPSSRRTGIIVSEIMYRPLADETDGNLEFLEIFNTQPIPQDLSGFRLEGSVRYTFPPNTILAPGAFLVLAKEPGSVEAVHGINGVLGPYDGRLDRDDGEIFLVHRNGGVLLDLDYSAGVDWPAAANGAGHSLVLARPSFGEGDRRAWAASDLIGGSPGRADAIRFDPLRAVVVNEFLARPDAPELDFIELYNTGDTDVDLSGAFLSDKPYEVRFAIPEGTILPAHGFITWTELELGFALSSSGEGVYLTDPAQTRRIDAVRFKAQKSAISMGRYPDGAPGFRTLVSPTPNEPNLGLRISDVIINELMYNAMSGDPDDEYVELYNRGDEAVNVSHWELDDGVRFTIPENTIIPAGGYLVIARNAARLIANYPNLNSGNTVGDYSGSPSNRSDRIALLRPADRFFPGQDMIIVNEVTYYDGGRWGIAADGEGSSLELIDPGSDNRLAPNWAPSDESEKSAWTTIEHTGVLDHGMGVSDHIEIILINNGEALVDNVEVLLHGTNRVPNGDFSAGMNGWSAQGNHVESGITSRDAYSGGQSLHLVATGGGDTGPNAIRAPLTASLSSGATVTIRAQARWITGQPDIVLRLRGNYLEASGRLDVPRNLGTPGAPNSQLVANAGPAITDVAHHPVLPAAGEPVTIIARLHDPDGIDSVILHYGDDSAEPQSVPMTAQEVDATTGNGLYSATIPGRPDGTLVQFAISATDKNPTPVTTSFPNDAPDRTALVRFGETLLPGDFGSYRLWVSQEKIDQWSNSPPLSNAYHDATFVYGDHRVIYNAEARYRGSPFIRQRNNNPTGVLSAYAIDLPNDDRMLGANSLNLDWLEQPDRDNTLQREKLTLWIAEQLGLPFFYQRYVYVYINGAKRGEVYTDSQHINSDFVNSWWPDDREGDLHKIEDWFEFNFPDFADFSYRDATLENFTTTGGEKKKARYRWNWEKKNSRGLDDDYTNLFALVDAVNSPESTYTEQVEELVDVEQWMRIFSVRRAVADWDGYGYDRGKNTVTYKPERGRWNMILWDLDFSLGGGSRGPTAGLFGAQDPVIDRMYAHPPFMRAYLRAFHDAITGPLRNENIDPVMDANYRAFQENNVAAASPSAVKSWVSARRNFIEQQLATYDAPFTVTTEGDQVIPAGDNLFSLQGQAPVAVKTILINGVAYPATWTTPTEWYIQFPITSGLNHLTLTALDAYGNPLPEYEETFTVTLDMQEIHPQFHLVINEIMYNPAVPDTEFVEIHNTSDTWTFDLTGYRLRGIDFDFNHGTLIGPGAYLVIVKDLSAFTATYGSEPTIAGVYSGRLQTDGERLRLVRLPTETEEELVVSEVTYSNTPPWPGAADGGGASLQLIDPRRDTTRVGNWAAVEVAVPEPGQFSTPGKTNSVRADLAEFPDLWINEIQPVNLSGITGADGEPRPWAELYNAGSADISLDGFFLTDDYGDLIQWPFPADAVIAAGEFLIVWLDGLSELTSADSLHTNFEIDPVAGSLALSRADENLIVIIDAINYENIAPDYSYGLFPDGDPEHRQIFQNPTPGGPNTSGLPTLTELIMPRFIQGEQDVNGENFNRVPFAFRLRIDGLIPGAAYRYGNRVVDDEDPPTQNGAGNMIFVKTDGSAFIRNTNAPRFLPTDFNHRHNTFVADAKGSFSGWFVTEPTGNRRIVPGVNLRMRLLLNDGEGGEEYHHFLTAPSEIEVIEFGSGEEQASAILGSATAPPKNFVVLYDDMEGASRPLTATFIESSGAEVDDRYATFYHQQVGGVDGVFGALIPNDLAGGIRRVEERSLTTGEILSISLFPAGAPGTESPSTGLAPITIDLADGGVGAGYTDWVESAFPPEDRDLPEISGPDADPDGDGLPNILEYALGGDPLSPDRTRLPQVNIESGHLTLTFPRDPSRLGIAYLVEASSDLSDWTDILYDSRVDTDPNNDGEFMTISDSAPLSSFPEGKRFVRLRIVFD